MELDLINYYDDTMEKEKELNFYVIIVCTVQAKQK